MGRQVTSLVVAGVLAVTSTVLGQAQAPPSNAEHMEKLSGFIGTWKTQVDAEEEIPGLVKKGDRLDITLKFDWRLNKNAIAVTYFLTTAGGVRFFEFEGMAGWHPLEKTYVSGGFDSIGGHSHAVWSRDGDAWHLNSSEVGADGTEETSILVLSDISDTFASQTTDRKRGDEELPDTSRAEWKRVE